MRGLQVDLQVVLVETEDLPPIFLRNSFWRLSKKGQPLGHI